MIISGICQCIVPFCSNFYLLALVIGIEGFFFGGLDPVVSACIIFLYKDKVGPYMQAMHFFNSIGILLVPLTVRLSMANFDDNYSYSFYFIGLMMFLPGCLLLKLPTPLISEIKEEKKEEGESKMKLSWEMLTLISCGILFGLYDGATTGFGPFVFVYAHF